MTEEMARALAEAGYLSVAEYLVIVEELKTKATQRNT
jgi:hypothetical protein